MVDPTAHRDSSAGTKALSRLRDRIFARKSIADGWPGIFGAASLLFFAYIGFEAVSTAASESRSPQRDMPIGILGSLVVCTVAYIAVALVLTGIVPFRQLGVPDPIALAVDRIGWPNFAAIIKLGALMGLASVLLVNSYAQSRIGFAMARDGLLPGFFARLHQRWTTPYLGTLALGLAAAAMAALLPLSLLADLISIGTAFAFAIVCLSVMWLRSTQPDLERPFRVPLAVSGSARHGSAWCPRWRSCCACMIVPTAMDVGRQALAGDIIPAAILIGYLVLGVLLYLTYGLRRSRTAWTET
jgi:basic amino acid/polyamine antiporter, APA family